MCFWSWGFLGFLEGLCRTIRVFVPLGRKGDESSFILCPNLFLKGQYQNYPMYESKEVQTGHVL